MMTNTRHPIDNEELCRFLSFVRDTVIPNTTAHLYHLYLFIIDENIVLNICYSSNANNKDKGLLVTEIMKLCMTDNTIKYQKRNESQEQLILPRKYLHYLIEEAEK